MKDEALGLQVSSGFSDDVPGPSAHLGALNSANYTKPETLPTQSLHDTLADVDKGLHPEYLGSSFLARNVSHFSAWLQGPGT